MAKRITIIEDSREAQLRFLNSLPPNEQVELQPITVAPFFDEKIEQAITEFEPHLIILDLRLSRDEESGFRVLRKLKSSETLKDIPVVVCSRFISRDPKDVNGRKALDYGAAVALPKAPFPKAETLFKYIRGADTSKEKLQNS